MWLIPIAFLVLLIPILAIVLDSQLGKALASRLERRGPEDSSRLSQERIAFLERETERLSAEVDRLSEESRFLHQLLADRSEDQGHLPPGEERR